MKASRIPLLIPVFALACSSPSAPTPAAAASPVASTRGTSLQMILAPDSVPGVGFRSPMSVTLRATDGTSPAVILSADFRMLDAQGNLLAQATLALGDPLPPDGYLSGDLVVQTLRWPAESGPGRTIGGSLTFRGTSGEIRTLPLTIPAR